MEKLEYTVKELSRETGTCGRCGKTCTKITFDMKKALGRNVVVDNCKCHETASEDYTEKQSSYHKSKRVDTFVRHKKQANLIERYKGLNLKTFPLANDYKIRDNQKFKIIQVNDYLKTFEGSQWLTLYGETGTGKTTLLQYIVRYMLNKWGHYPSRYITFRGLADELITGNKSLGLNRNEIESYYKSLYCLCLDEYDTSTIHISSRVFEILNYRYDRKKATIIASNLDLPTLEDEVTARLFDRMRDTGNKIVHFNWRSLRGSEKTEKVKA